MAFPRCFRSATGIYSGCYDYYNNEHKAQDSMAAALISPDGGQAHAPRGQRMDEGARPGVKTGAVR